MVISHRVVHDGVDVRGSNGRLSDRLMAQEVIAAYLRCQAERDEQDNKHRPSLLSCASRAMEQGATGGANCPCTAEAGCIDDGEKDCGDVETVAIVGCEIERGCGTAAIGNLWPL